MERRKLVRQPVAAKAVEPEDEEIDVEEDVDVEAEEEADVDEEAEEEPAPARKAVTAPVATRKVVVPPPAAKAAPAKAVAAPAAKPAAPAAKPVAKPAVAAVPAKKVVAAPVADDGDEAEEAAPAAPKTVKISGVAATVINELLDALEAGQALLFTKTADGKFTVNATTAKAVAATANSNEGKLKGAAYWNEVLDPEYVKWDAEWQQMTANEKLDFAKKNKVTWEVSDDPRVNMLRATEAIREKLGIVKYKPEYATIKARNAIRAS